MKDDERKMGREECEENGNLRMERNEEGMMGGNGNKKIRGKWEE